MKKTLLLSFAFLLAMSVSANDTRTTFHFDVQRNYDSSSATKCPVSQAVLGKYFDLSGDLTSYLQQGNIRINANYFNSTGVEKFYAGYTADPYGHWFAASGMPTNKEKNYAVKIVYENSNFYLSHDLSNTSNGDAFELREAVIKTATKDTLIFIFNVVLGNKTSVSTDQAEFYARKNYTDDWVITPTAQKNDGELVFENFIQVNEGDKITLGGEIKETDKYILDTEVSASRPRWYKVEWDRTKKAEKNTAISKYLDEMNFTITESATKKDCGRYYLKARFKRSDGVKIDATYYYYVDVQTEDASTFHVWNAPQLSYDFRDEFPKLDKPTKLHSIKKKNGQPANCYAGEWWSIYWGDNLNPECGKDSATINAAARNMAAQYDYDFAYMRDSIGWIPDLSARKGYKSFVYIFGSGLANDNESQTTQGGYQSSTYADGSNWACVWASYYPFSRFRDDADQKWSDGEYQRNAMIHEGIHATFADMGACQGSSWFHEGGNTWLQGQVYAKRDGVHGDAGYLDGGPFLAPHMPIECYSGWLQDGSYGGPAAQGVNMYNASGSQVCTWRTYLGGVQYANAFPTVIANVCGEKSIAWIWRYCKNRVLETMGDTLGDEAMREIILQYRARQALFDLGGWDKSYRNVTNSYFGTAIKAEWSPYWIDVPAFKLTPYQSVTVNDASGWLAPDTLTNPGWSGANQIPIHVNRDGGICEIEFRPEDTNMMALLCYRTKSGECYYSHPVHCGTMSIDLSKKPANGVIFCIVANTDYIYKGDSQRKHHWDYRIRLKKNAWQIADVYQRWYLYEQTVTDPNYNPTGIESQQSETNNSQPQESLKILNGKILAGGTIQTSLSGTNAKDVSVRMIGISGVVVSSGKLNYDGTFNVPTNLSAGFYVITFTYNGKTEAFKIIVN